MRARVVILNGRVKVQGVERVTNQKKGRRETGDRRRETSGLLVKNWMSSRSGQRSIDGSQGERMRKVEERWRLRGLGRGGCARTPKPRFRWVGRIKMASLLVGF